MDAVPLGGGEDGHARTLPVANLAALEDLARPHGRQIPAAITGQPLDLLESLPVGPNLASPIPASAWSHSNVSRSSWVTSPSWTAIVKHSRIQVRGAVADRGRGVAVRDGEPPSHAGQRLSRLNI